MLTREHIQELLRGINDRETGQSLLDLQRIRDLMVKEERVSLTIVCLNEDEPAKAELEQEVREKLREGGLEQVHIRLRNATDHERQQLGHAAAGQKEEPEEEGRLKGHAAGMEEHELLDEESGVHFIAVASGKGGVGKSTVTVNLAVALARMGKRVGLIDADIYGFSVPDMMGIEEGPTVDDGTIIPVERFGVKVMSMGFFIRENSPVIWRGPMLGKMLRQFVGDVRWGELDYMLLDLPPGTGDVALDVHQMLPQSKEIIVTTPHATAAFVAARAGSMALQTDHDVLGVVENMAYYQCSGCDKKDYIFGRGGGARLAETLHTDLLGQLPLGAPDNHVSEPDFSPSVYKADHPTGELFTEIAERIVLKCEL